MRYRIKEYRELLGWSQSELSRRSGVPQSAISRYEAGEQEPGYSRLKRIADALGISVEELESDQSIAKEGKRQTTA